MTLIDTTDTYVIAEAGINHDGNLDVAKRLVEEAATVGADAVKFQIWNADELAATDQWRESLASWGLAAEEWRALKRHADETGIDFSASVFDTESVDFAVDLGVPFLKVASGDVTHHPLLEHIASKDLPVIMSTGMCTLGEIEAAIETVRPPSADLYLLECISAYPTELADLDLSVMETLETAFGLPVGFSDHTEGTLAPQVAAGMGAEIVEKHFTLDSTRDGPDHELSLEPDEFSEMVDGIRQVDAAVGDGVKRPRESEADSKDSMRRALKAREDIDQDTTLSADAVKIARPNEGIAPKHYHDVLGRETNTQIKRDEPITWSKLH